MNFDGFSGINAFFTVILVIGAAILIIAQTRKISHEQLMQTAKEWQDIATARSERVNVLQQQLGHLQEQTLMLTGRISAMERDREFLMQKNLDLERRLLDRERRIGQLEAEMTRAVLAIPGKLD
jgi:TolA-binding protein